MVVAARDRRWQKWQRQKQKARDGGCSEVGRSGKPAAIASPPSSACHACHACHPEKFNVNTIIYRGAARPNRYTIDSWHTHPAAIFHTSFFFAVVSFA